MDQLMKSVLAVAAHPDDIEFLMAGTLLRLQDAGFEVHYWNLANGCYGSNQSDRQETSEIRRLEAITACKQLNARFNEPICDDLAIFYDRPTLAKVASVIRDVQPEIILTHSLEDYMEDHTNTARLVVTGAFARAMKNFSVEPVREPTSQAVCLYHAQPYSNRTPLRKLVVPEIFVDTSDLLARKKELLSCHVSQKQWLDCSQGLDSYLDTLEGLDRQVGEMSGRYELAEGWRRHLHLGLGNEDEDRLVSALEEGDVEDLVFFEE